jgi:hypothetical protein
LQGAFNRKLQKAIKSLSNADSKQPPGTAVLLLSGDATTWEKKSLEGDTEAGKDPPKEEEENLYAAVATEQGEINPMTMESDG